MNFFNKLFSSNTPSEELRQAFPWKPLTAMHQMDEMVELSKTKTVLIFKHSTRCGISRMTLRQFESGFDPGQKTIAMYFLDLLAYRELSNEISARFQVLHQSPQMLVIKKGECVAHGSHYDILELEIN